MHQLSILQFDQLLFFVPLSWFYGSMIALCLFCCIVSVIFNLFYFFRTGSELFSEQHLQYLESGGCCLILILCCFLASSGGKPERSCGTRVRYGRVLSCGTTLYVR